MKTVKDIAEKAQVSEATVSRVINNYPHVKEETRKRVLAVIEEFDYYPNPIARGMRTQKTSAIGLLLANITNPFYAETATAVMDVAEQHGYSVILCITKNDSKRQENFIRILQQKKVDGFLFGSVLLNDPPVKQLINNGSPYVLFNRIFKNNDHINYVSLDNALGLYMAVDHLVRLGHDKIAFIRGCKNFSTFEERYRGYINALQECGLEFDKDLVVEGESEQHITHKVTAKLLNSKNRPTAIIASNDFMAFSALEVISKYNLRAPEDIAVIGFHDVEMASHNLIQLTTIGHNKYKMSEIATQSLIQIIEGKELPIQVILKPQLIVRKTCGAYLSENSSWY